MNQSFYLRRKGVILHYYEELNDLQPSCTQFELNQLLLIGTSLHGRKDLTNRGFLKDDIEVWLEKIVLVYTAFTFADHCPIIINTTCDTSYHKLFPFRFQNFWTNYQALERIVSQNGKFKSKSCNMFQFSQKMNHIKTDVKPQMKSRLMVIFKIK